MAPSLRFNQKNLQALATQSAEKFHKEGILWFKEKEGKLFTKSEGIYIIFIVYLKQVS